MNAWNFIGASYDFDSGIARLWHDGNDVEAKYIGQKLELATHCSIRIGALAVAAQRCFQGRVSDLHIFAESLGKVTIRAIGGIVPQDGAEAGGEEAEEEEDEEDENPDVLYEADAMQDQRILDNDDVRVFGAKGVLGKGGRLRVVNPFAFSGVTEDGWQIQHPERLKKKLKRIIVQELS